MNRIVGLVLLLVLAACNAQPQQTGDPPDKPFLGLLKVTVTGIGEAATPSATAEFVNPASLEVSGQAATVVPVNGTTALNDVQFTRSAVNFSDDDSNLAAPTRYVYTTFALTNRTSTNFANLTLYAVNVPSNLGGTDIVSMSDATGAAITDAAVARGFQPVHGMRPSGLAYKVNADNADLQWITPSEASNRNDGIKEQAVSANIIPNTATVLEYGFVARNLSAGRLIAARNLSSDCTTNACKGSVTLAYKFPRISPRANNPFGFSMYFVVANEANTYVSQSLEEQGANTTAGQTSGANQNRILFGSNLSGLDNFNNICQTRIAVAPDLRIPALPAPTSGSLDSCFGAGGRRTTAIGSSGDNANALILQPDGKLVAVGRSSNGVLNDDFSLVRYNTNGTLDTSFGTAGRVTTRIGSSNDIATAVVRQPDGKLVAAGYSFNGSNLDFALVRYYVDGSLDTSFGTGGRVTTAIGSSNDIAKAVVLQPDRKLVVAGLSTPIGGSNFDFVLVRYNANGTLDTRFGTGGKVTTSIDTKDDNVNALVLQPDGKIVAAGFGGNFDFALVRYNTDGTLDTNFGNNGDGTVTTDFGSSDERANALVLQPDGKLVAAGYSISGGFALVRYNADGLLDTSFGGGGKLTTVIGSSRDQAAALVVQPDGKLVAAGYSNNGGNEDFALARYNP